MPHEPPPFFHRGPSPASRLAFFGVLSLVLLFADTRFRYLENIRRVVTVVISPLQQAALLPQEAVGAVAAYFTSKRSLADDNAALRSALVAQAPAVQGYAHERDENARLKALLGVQTHYAGAATAAGVLYSGRDPFSQRLFIDKGDHDGVAPGEAVIDDLGVVGQVTRVFPAMAEVTLLTNKDHVIPVKVERTGVHSVLYGAGTGQPLELRFMPPSADLLIGDRLVTSGLDGTYPAGLAVAQVTAIDRDTGQIFARIHCAPLGGVARSEHLLVLGRMAAMPERPDEPDASAPGKAAARAKARRGT
ncbi:MAG: rod shape-determining protein MreC [Proteobacteria bacterium]|nr:rod shape-determining protein MreC [Pseudomonadota bacterium]